MSRMWDTVIAYKIIKLLNMRWEKWDAYKRGIIDNKGNKIKDKLDNEDRQIWTTLTVLVWNLKKLIEKLGGSSKLTSILATILLIRDSFQLGEDDVINIIENIENIEDVKKNQLIEEVIINNEKD